MPHWLPKDPIKREAYIAREKERKRNYVRSPESAERERLRKLRRPTTHDVAKLLVIKTEIAETKAFTQAVMETTEYADAVRERGRVYHLENRRAIRAEGQAAFMAAHFSGGQPVPAAPGPAHVTKRFNDKRKIKYNTPRINFRTGEYIPENYNHSQHKRG